MIIKSVPPIQPLSRPSGKFPIIRPISRENFNNNNEKMAPIKGVEILQNCIHSIHQQISSRTTKEKMYASSKVAALLLLVCPILLTNARPQNFETFFQQSGGNASELQQLKTAFKDVPKEVKANLALVFLSSFDLTSKQLEEKMVDALNGYQDAQNALKSMMTQAKQQKEQKFESYITALADSTKQQAAQNLLNNVVKNEDITLMDMCNQIMAYIGTLSAEDKALFIKTVHGGKGVPQGAGAPQGGPMALFGGSNTATDSSQNLCNKMEQWMEKMAGVLKERMSTSGNLAAPIANGAGTVQ